MTVSQVIKKSFIPLFLAFIIVILAVALNAYERRIGYPLINKGEIAGEQKKISP